MEGTEETDAPWEEGLGGGDHRPWSWSNGDTSLSHCHVPPSLTSRTVHCGQRGPALFPMRPTAGRGTSQGPG